jgi:hypothetical protein
MTDKVTEAMVEAAWEAFRDCPVDMCGDHDEEQKKCVVAALQAALVQAPVQVGEIGVKALEWEYKHQPYRSYPQWSAETVVGRYVVFDTTRSIEWYVEGKTQIHKADSVEEAQAAAQADYDQRIRSALALPLPVQEPVAWYRDNSFVYNFSLGKNRPHNATSNPNEWVPLYLHPETASVREGWKLVPIEPTPEMLGAWYRYKNGHHWPDEPPPRDTSDYGAYRAMLAASPNKDGSTDA